MDGNYLTSSSGSLLRETGPHRIQQSGMTPVQGTVKGAVYSIAPTVVVKSIQVTPPTLQPAPKR